MTQNQINILGIPFTTLNQSEVIALIKDLLNKPAKQFFLATPNPEMLLAAEADSHFKKILQSTNLNIPDGNGIIWAHIFQKQTAKNKSTFFIYIQAKFAFLNFFFRPRNDKKRFNQAIHGSDLMKTICHDPTLSQHSIFLLGNEHGLKADISNLTAQSLRNSNPSINIVGHFDGSPNNAHNLEKIRAASPEILFVAFGSPQQEIWLAEHLPKLPSVKLAIGVGGTFDFISGVMPRAPSIMRKMGLEWLYRLYKQPRRIGRIINAILVFPLKVIAERSHQLNSPKHDSNHQ